jgi:CAAX protease family protein
MGRQTNIPKCFSKRAGLNPFATTTITEHTKSQGQTKISSGESTMMTDNLGTKLVVGVAACGVALVIGGMRLYRRHQARRAVGAPEDDPQAAARSGSENAMPPEEPQDGKEPHGQAPIDASRRNLPRDYFLLLGALTVPFYLLGDRKLPLPVNLPASALAFVGSFSAALILAHRHRGVQGIKELLKKAIDYKKIKNKIWLVPSLFLAPAIYFLSYLIMRWLGRPLPEPQLGFLMALVFFALYLIEAPLEELGFMGLVIDPLQDRWGALRAGIILGSVWQIQHLIPLIQAHNSADWILWHLLEGVALRILMVWIYNNAGKSVFTSILVHTTVNVSWSMFPNYGSGYDPFFTCVLMWLAAALVAIGWGPKTLARFRFGAARQTGVKEVS